MNMKAKRSALGALMLLATLLLGGGRLRAQDLAVFDAHGPVKSIQYESGWLFFPSRELTYQFDRRGRWLPAANSDYVTIRDRRRRVVRHGYADVSQDNTQFYYNRRGRVSWTFHVWPDDEGAFHVTNFYYDRRGDVSRMMQRRYRGHRFAQSEAHGVSKVSVRITKRDRHGNWTSRELFIDGSSSPFVEKRTITYWK